MPIRAIISLKRLSAFTLLAPVLFFTGCGPSAAPKKVLIIQDEMPQIEVMAGFLREQGSLEVTVVEQEALPEDFSHSESKNPNFKSGPKRGGRSVQAL